MVTYILDAAGVPVPCPDHLEWGGWMEAHGRIAGPSHIGGRLISTVFLGCNDVLFETAVFEAGRLVEQLRTDTRGEALDAHQAAVVRYDQMNRNGL